MYLLPCACGDKREVDQTQAGLTVRCHCGAELVVPTMRGLAKLERATPGVTVPARTWNRRKGVLFLGACITLVSLAVLAFLRTRAPVDPQPYINRGFEIAGSTADLDRASTKDLWELWSLLRSGPDAHPAEKSPTIARLMLAGHEATFMRPIYQQLSAAHRQRMGVALVAAAIGAVILVVGFLMRKPVAAKRTAASR